MKHEIQRMRAYLSTTQASVDTILNRADSLFDQVADVKILPTTVIYLIGNGSSGEGVRIASYLAMELFDRSPICVTPYQFTHTTFAVLHPEDIVIVLSQTGTSHEVVESLRLAKAHHAKNISLTATIESPCAKLADIPVVLAECVEDVDYKVTGVVGLLYGLWIVLIGIALANHLIEKSESKKLLNQLFELNSRYDHYVSVAENWTKKNVERLESCFTLTVLGSGSLCETASEMSVKSIEVQNRYSLAMDTEEFLHGVCAANPKTNLIVMLVDKSTLDYSKKVYQAIKARNQAVLWIGIEAPEGDLDLDLIVSGKFSVMQFFPAIHSLLINWAELKDHGGLGTEVFAYYQNLLNVREKIEID